MSFVPDSNSIIRTAANAVTTNEAHNAGNLGVVDLGPGTPIAGLWAYVQNPATITGTTPGLTVTLAYSADLVTWVAGPAVVVLNKGVTLVPFNTPYRYISADFTRGASDNVIGTVCIGVTDAVTVVH